MNSKKKQHTTSSEPREKLLDPALVKLLGIVTLAYILLWALVGSLLGSGFVALIAAPLLGISLFVITKWDRTRTSDDHFSLKQLLIFPQLNYWNILWVVLSIFIAGQILSLPIFVYLNKTREGFIETSPDDFAGFFSTIADDRQATILFLVAVYMAHTVGGFIAGWLPNKRVPHPYRHAVTGSLIYSLLNVVLVVPLLAWNDQIELPSEQEAGLIILGITPSFIFSMLGVWLAIGTRRVEVAKGTPQPLDGKSEATSSLVTSTAYNKTKKQSISKQKNKKRLKTPRKDAEQLLAQAIPSQLQEQPNATKIRWLRRWISILFVCMVLAASIGVVVWVVTMKGPVDCPNPPTTATLNFWPVTYSAPAEYCHDYQSINARLVGEDHLYSQNQEEWQRGLSAKAGDEIYALVYINNGAATNAEKLNPGRGIAHNVQLTTEISSEPSEVHYIKVRIAGDNTNTVVSSFKITTALNERLEVVPKSGEIRNYTATELIAKDLDVGNNTINIGDLPPKWEDCLFIRFRLKVVA